MAQNDEKRRAQNAANAASLAAFNAAKAEARAADQADQAHTWARRAQRDARQAKQIIDQHWPEEDDRPSGGDPPDSGLVFPTVGFAAVEDPGTYDRVLEGDVGRVDLDARLPDERGARHIGAHSARISKLTLIGAPGGHQQARQAHIWGATFENEPTAKTPIRTHDFNPPHVTGHDFRNNPAPSAGLLALHRCHFKGHPDAYTWNVDESLTGGREAPFKWNLHTHLYYDLWMDECTGEFAQEHHPYGKNWRRVHINNCRFGFQGGTWFQSASRRGRIDVPGYTQGYTHGNPYYHPAGLDGWALIENCRIDGTNIWSRKGSEIHFAGFLGPIVLRNLEIVNCKSALDVWSDVYKGAWYTRDSSGALAGHWTEGDGQPLPERVWTCPYFGMDEIEVQPNGNDDRPLFHISGVYDVNIGRFVMGGSKQMVFDAQYGGPWPNGRVRFWDADSAWAHFGRIGTWNRDTDRFQAYTEAELDAKIVS